MDHTFTVTLIRHFPTKGNIDRKYIGWTDEPIIPHKAVHKIGEVGRVFGSDLLRCVQTADLLFGNVPYIENAKLRECSFGLWEEKTYEELKEEAAYIAWLEDFHRIAPPGGESLEQLEVRVVDGFQEIISQTDHAIIVTHGGPMRALLSKFVTSSKSFWEWEVSHGSMYTLKWKDRQDVLEGKHCTSFSVEHLTENKIL